MNDQQRAAMQMALKALEALAQHIEYYGDEDEVGVFVCCGEVSYRPHSAFCKTTKAITALREALAQPQDHSEQHLNMVQGEWVDLTEDEMQNCHCLNGTAYPFALAIIAKFKSKNTPPVVPQGEPVACNCQELERLAEEAECVRLSLDKANIPTADSEGAIYSLWGRVCRYAERTAPPVVPQVVTEGNASKVRSTDTGEPVAYVTEHQNLLPYGLTLIQTNPDCAVQLNAGRDFGWLYMKGAEGQWVTHRKLSPEEINEAQDQTADMVVIKRESVLEKMFAAPITTPPSVEAAIEATKEKAAKVCEEIVIENGGKTARNKTSFECAAAIRSMK